jgi:uncharacterized membrane protein YphA (DoxX/SURF4 family)
MVVAVGRVLFAVLFVVSGVLKLADLSATAKDIAAHLTLPPAVSPYADQIAAFTGMPFEQVLAIAAGATEVICALMIALNFGTRFFAVVLMLFVLVATFYYYPFWDTSSPKHVDDAIEALKNLSLVGALLIIAGFPRTLAGEPDLNFGERQL